MNDFVRDAAQRQHRARQKRRGLRQPPQAGGDPAAMPLREIPGVGDSAARRDRQDRFAVTWMNSKRVATGAAMPAQSNRVDLRAVLDQESRRFVRPPIKEGASGHVC